MTVTRIVLAGGRRLLREGVSLLLQRNQSLRVIGDAADVTGAFALAGAMEPDLLLLCTGSDLDIADVMTRLRAIRPMLPVVLLLPSVAAYDVRRALAAGVAGCLSRDCASDDLVSAVSAVIRGEQYVCAQLKQSLLNALLTGSGNHVSGGTLSPREREILRRIASGRSTKEIAGEFDIGTKTVETHRRRIMDKLGRRSIAELTQYAMLHGLLEADEDGSARTVDDEAPTARRRVSSVA